MSPETTALALQIIVAIIKHTAVMVGDVGSGLTADHGHLWQRLRQTRAQLETTADELNLMAQKLPHDLR